MSGSGSGAGPAGGARGGPGGTPPGLSPGLSPLASDALGLWAATTGLPEQVAHAGEAAVALAEGVPSARRPADVTVLGVGTAALAGAAVAALTPVPVTVVETDAPPPWVGAGSLVFALSWSGETAETVAAAEAARCAGATVVPVAGGGALGAAAAAAGGGPLADVLAAAPAARAAFGAMVAAPLVVLDHVGLAPGAAARVRSAAGELARRRDEAGDARAREIARRIGRTFPLVHGTPGVAAVAARRWKAQVNVNARSPAFWSTYPDLCRDEVAGWGQHGDVTRQLLTVVRLRHGGEAPGLARRMAALAELLDEVVAGVVDVQVAATDDLARLLELVLLGDLVSLHLAAAAGIDPGPVPVRDELEELTRPTADRPTADRPTADRPTGGDPDAPS